MTFLVTGASGQVGSALTAALKARGESVRVLLRDNAWHPLLNGLDIEVVRGNLLNAQDVNLAVKGCQGVFHVAGSISYLPQDRWKMMQVNVHGTDLILQAALKHNVQKLVHTSSTAAIGYCYTPERLDENAALSPALKSVGYLYTKELAEQRVKEAVKKGLIACMVNPSSILGPGDIKGNSQNMYQQVQSGRVVCPPGGNAVVSVHKVVEGHLLAMDTLTQENAGERYILSSFNWEYTRLFKEIAQAGGLSLKHLFRLPTAFEPFLKLAAKGVEQAKPEVGLSAQVIDFSFAYRYYDSKKAQRELSWKPDTLSEMTQTLKEAHAFYSEN